MNIIFTIMMICSIIMICLQEPDSAVGFMLNGTSEAVRLTIKLTAIYSLWTGILQIMSDSGVEKTISKVFAPITKRLFKGASKEAQSSIAMNFTANFLGMGGAATAMGINAISQMGEKKTNIDRNMMMFFIINVSSIQLLPTMVIALRSSYGSKTSSDIILPSLVASIFTTLVGVILVLVIEKIKDKWKFRHSDYQIRHPERIRRI